MLETASKYTAARTATNPSAPAPRPAKVMHPARRTQIIVPQFKASGNQWDRLTRLFKDEGIFGQMLRRQEAQRGQREAMARRSVQDHKRRGLDDMEHVASIPLHDFVRLTAAQKDFLHAGNLKFNLNYLKKRSDLPIFV